MEPHSFRKGKRIKCRWRFLWPVTLFAIVATSFRVFSAGYFQGSLLTEERASEGGQVRAPTATDLVITTNSRLLLYDPDKDTVRVVTQSEVGGFYGVFPGVHDQKQSIWVVTKPKDWRAGDGEYLSEVDFGTGQITNKVEVDSMFTHDTVRRGDRVYVCDTSRGRILVLQFPTMQQIKVLDLFSRSDHINTLAPLEKSQLWVVLHNLGRPSKLVKVDVEAAEIVSTFDNIGRMVHGLVEWGDVFVMLDSDRGALITLNPRTGAAKTIWKAPEEGAFLKGLAVIDGIAYFGANKKAQRKARHDPSLNADLVAVDLFKETMLWRQQLPTRGLLNIVGAPLLSEASTYKAIHTGKEIGGHWPSGLPFKDLEQMKKNPAAVLSYTNLTTVSITELKSFVEGKTIWTEEYQEKHNAILKGRSSTMARFKPGVEDVLLIFSSNHGQDSYVFPLFHKMRDLLQPIINKVLGEGSEDLIMRMQLASMPPGAEIKPHRDSGGYAQKAHRIHVPITTPPGTLFEVCPKGNNPDSCEPLPLEPGHVFEINNAVKHKAINTGKKERIHLILDVQETPMEHQELRKGQVCNYKHTTIIC